MARARRSPVVDSGRTQGSRGAHDILLRVTALDWAAALELLRSSREGLSVEDAAARLESTGPNELPTPHGPSLPSQFAEQLIHFFALMLWVAAGLAFVGGMPALGVAIFGTTVAMLVGTRRLTRVDPARRPEPINASASAISRIGSLRPVLECTHVTATMRVCGRTAFTSVSTISSRDTVSSFWYSGICLTEAPVRSALSLSDSSVE